MVVENAKICSIKPHKLNKIMFLWIGFVRVTDRIAQFKCGRSPGTKAPSGVRSWKISHLNKVRYHCATGPCAREVVLAYWKTSEQHDGHPYKVWLCNVWCVLHSAEEIPTPKVDEMVVTYVYDVCLWKVCKCRFMLNLWLKVLPHLRQAYFSFITDI